MNVRKLQRRLGPDITATRDRRTRVVSLSGSGLTYRADETKFSSERELAEYARSKMPVQTLIPHRA